MMQVRRSAREVGSWGWSIPFTRQPKLMDMLAGAKAAIDALRSARMLHQGELRVFWQEKGVRLGEIISLPIPNRNPLTDLIRSVEDSTPSGYTNPFINYIKVEGSGSMKLPGGSSSILKGLAEVNIFDFPDSVDIELTIHHDIWFPHGFDGYPHPQIHDLNSPRLTTVLQQIESELGEKTEPGDGTFFGQPGKLGMLPPEAGLRNETDLLDVTDISNVGWTFQEVPCGGEWRHAPRGMC